MAESRGFEKLRQKRLRLVESARENDFEDGLRSLLSELYPDNAHFIYELLQNAEDALATAVEFSLAEDHLTVTHDGKRPFSLDDIESITGIGKSTKKDDPTQIGKFGVGFKAVFAYTTRPEVRSGEHSFAIADLFVPEEISDAAIPGATTFTFPFDRDDKSAVSACNEVQRGLTDLDEKTLLFLNSISLITYELPNGAVGIIEREPLDDRVIRIKRSEGDDFAESHWLRIVGPTSVDQDATTPLTVAAAFRLELETPSKSKQGKQKGAAGAPSEPTHSIVPLEEGDVSIYFPAVKESSGLRFHIHAPFASTVARDSVRDDPGNVRLVMDIAALIVESLPALCIGGLIDDKFLATLPNHEDPIGAPYDLIRKAITNAFNELAITPVWGSGGMFAAASALVSSPSEFRNWLDPGDLPVLFELAEIESEESPHWIRDRDGRPGKFLSGLDTIKFGWSELGSSLDNAHDVGDPDDPFIANWLAWLGAKSDAAIANLYQLIGRGRTTHQLSSADLKMVPMVRLRRRGSVQHVKGTETFLPSSRVDAVQSRVPVDLAYFEDDEDPVRAHNLKAFYNAAGVTRWNESARIERRLAAYKGHGRIVPDGENLARHLDDVRSFVRHGLSNRQTARAMFGQVRLLQAVQSDGSSRWVSPQQTFLDLPFRDTGLSALYPRVKLHWKNGSGFAYDQEPYPLAGFYVEVDGIEEFLEVVGATGGIEIIRAEVSENPQFLWAWKHSSRETSYGERVDWGIKCLDKMLQTGNQDLLRSLWHAVVTAPASKATASYKANASAPRHPMDSQLVQALKATPWVLDRNGDLKLPREVTVEDLPEDWERPAHNSLVYKLDFGAEATKRRQKREGVSEFLREEGLDEDGIDLLREAKELGVTNADIRHLLREREATARFPEGASDNPERRTAVAALDAASAPEHTTAVRERSIVEGQVQASAESKAYLREQYTSVAGEVHCQACRKVVPFRTKDGLWYFEAVRFITARKQVHTANAIALCPLCAALYKYARQTKNESLVERLASRNVDMGQGSVEIPVSLNNERVKITFTGRHAIDIKAALGVAGGERDTDR
jgi:hypothetical protein